MITEPTELLAENPDWIRVLAAYVEAEQELAASQQPQQPSDTGQQVADESEEDESPQSKKWLPRIRQVDDVPLSQLPAIHGKLIAHGLLKPIRCEGRESRRSAALPAGGNRSGFRSRVRSRLRSC